MCCLTHRSNTIRKTQEYPGVCKDHRGFPFPHENQSEEIDIYIINPRAATQAYFSADVFEGWGFEPTVLIADLATTTVAAMVPETFDIRLCDEHVTPIDYETPCDFVALTGKSSQVKRMLEIAREFRRRGTIVMIGGPFASLDPNAVRADCDILVQGEIEGIASTLFNDVLNGTWKSHYRGDRPDLSQSPIPRWDLYPNHRAIIGAVQTSRGCPFECEFCDVPSYLGRKQRHKKTEQVLAELDVLYGLGYRSIFLADDNFTVYRQRAKALLLALRGWNEKQTNGPVFFQHPSIDRRRTG